MAEQPKGLIFNIQRFSVHDGPGIRTIVFMMGCPLKCRWCSNPESQFHQPLILTRDINCIRCGRCVEACPTGAITIDEQKGRIIDRTRCNYCLQCAKVCPTEAITVCGKWLSLDEVMTEVNADKVFYQNSGGGITISGGEMLSQPAFVRMLLKRCKVEGLHTAVETCGYGPWKILASVLDYVDLALFDVKHMEPRLHQEGTGKNNIIILDNLVKTAAKVKTWIRMPLIPGYNDSETNMIQLVELAKHVGVEKVSLLTYHEWGKAKYEQLGISYGMKEVPPLSPEHLKKMQGILEGAGLQVGIDS